MANVFLKILTHELDDVIFFLLDEYNKTWNPFKKKKLKILCNKLYKYMYPNSTNDLIR